MNSCAEQTEKLSEKGAGKEEGRNKEIRREREEGRKKRGRKERG